MFQHAICVACATGAERSVSENIEKNLSVAALYPAWVRELKGKGGFMQRDEAVLPGYVFVYADDLSCIGAISRMEKVLHILRYGDGSYGLYGDDLAFARWVYAQNGRIGLSRAMMAGDEMVIIDGPMKDYEGRIKRIDKHNRYAQIEITLGGVTRNVWLGFQWMTFQDGELVRWEKSKNEG